MKINITFYFIFFSSFWVTSQNKVNETINWTEKKELSYGQFSYVVPQFNSQNFEFDTYSKSISYTLTMELNANVSDDAIQISNLIYEPITENEMGDIDKNNIPTIFKSTFKCYNAREKYYGKIQLTPIIKTGGSYSKLVSFSYLIQQNKIKSGKYSNSTFSIENSVLNSGNWYRFYIQKSGVYKITKSFLQSLGFDTNADPRKIKIYGNGGRMLPLLNSEDYPNDLTENAIEVIGENDGVLDAQDFILFYGEGIDKWNEDYKSNLNIYADKSYYYITSQGDLGKRISEMTQPSENSLLTINTFDDTQFHEIDKENLKKLGRVWFGENFSIENEQEFKFNFPNIVSTSPIEIRTHVAAVTSSNTNFKVESNSQLVGTVSLNPGSSSETIVLERNFIASISNPTEEVTIKVSFNNNGVPSAKGYLDYINLKAKRNLKGYGKQFHFQFDQANANLGVAEFQLSNANSITQVWDITDRYNITKVQNNSQTNFSFKANLGEVRNYIAVDNIDYYLPQKESKSKIENQNLKGAVFNNTQGQWQKIDYLIITPNFLIAQAEKLANFHRNYSNLSVKVVALENIYPEFSSGKQDIAAIRNFVKYVYFNAPAGERVKYLNIFGDASFDFKDRIPNNTNIVPIYQALNSYTESQISFATDDFFGMMDDDEGQLDSGNSSFNGSTSFSLDLGGIDIAVGRMIVSTVQQAEEMVNKVLEYHDIKSYGSWRTNYVAIADDSDKPSDTSMQFKQNNLTDLVASQKPFINFKKILLDSYQQESSAGGKRYPKARADIFEAFEKGALAFNYIGHGGEDGLSAERIWEKSDGQNLNNRYKYPLFITITCDFSRFDNPYRPTAGEFIYWNPRGGAISMITTVRSIDQGNAEIFNDRLAEYLFSYNSNQYTTMAEALRQAKNFNPTSASNVVFYLGDPAIMMAIPKPKVVLTKVNNVPVNETIDDFKSLAYVKLTGEILDENNNQLPTYNGELFTTIYDKNVIRNTLNNDNYSTPIAFTNLGEAIFRGNASVISGRFEFGFVVPRDIRITVGNGRISFYAKRNQIQFDKYGQNTDIKIGGINLNAVADNISPSLQLYMNDETFVNGSITNDSPFLLAKLEDENGINTASGIGHDIIGILDGDETKPYIMNDYYQTELNDYKKGRIYFPLRNLTAGLHTITFKAWDVYNNPITSEIQFVVVGNENIALENVLNYPNPFVSYTEFWFSHNKPFEPLEVQVQVMTITGKIVWTKNQTVTTVGFLSRDITWDGKDDFGDRIGKGVYVYKLTVKSTLSNKKAEKIEKLVIL